MLSGHVFVPQRWRDEIAPDLALSHPDMAPMVAEKGKFDATHANALKKFIDDFLDESLVTAKRQVSRFRHHTSSCTLL